MTEQEADVVVAGTDEERGIIAWREQIHEDPTDDDVGGAPPTSCYDIPVITKYLRHQKWARYVPFLPSFDESLVQCACCSKKRKEK